MTQDTLEKYAISLYWSTTDVKAIAPDLSFDEWVNVLQRVKRFYDDNGRHEGVTWETIYEAVRLLYPNTKRLMKRRR